MKKLTLIYLISFFAITTFAQPGDSKEKREKIRAAKIAHITSEINLTPEQAEKFWPVYNEYSEKRRAIRKELKQIHKSRHGAIDEASDAELKADMEKINKLRQQELDLDIEYQEKFLKVISMKQLAKLYHAEREFKRRLEHRIRSQRGPGGPGGRGPGGQYGPGNPGPGGPPSGDE